MFDILFFVFLESLLNKIAELFNWYIFPLHVTFLSMLGIVSAYSTLLIWM